MTMSSAQALTFLVPGLLKTRTGGFIYDRRIIGGLREQGWTVDVQELDEGFPRPNPPARARAVRALATIADESLVVVDGLALGTLPEELEKEADRLRIVALIHHPLAHETGLEAEAARDFEISERRALNSVRQVIVTSRATATSLIPYGVDPLQIQVVEPGTDRVPVAHGSQGATLELITVGTVIPRKGHGVLFKALAAVPMRNWRLTCVGSLERDRPTVTRLRAQLAADKLSDRVRLLGDVDSEILGACYERADLFILPTCYEGYGMAVAEAIARGLPVISTSTGAIPELIRDGAGILVPPGDVPALSAAIAEVLGDVSVRHRLAEGARRTRDSLPTWEDSARKFADALARVAAHGRVFH
jgi:glycosyltransferase involved in cell wall biosynthesis